MEIKVLSSLSKVFGDEICNENVVENLTGLKNERISFQIAIKNDEDCNAELAANNPNVCFYNIGFVPAKLAAPKGHDSYYIRGGKEGLYPDLLVPNASSVELKKGEWVSVWCEFCSKEAFDGEIEISVGEIKAKIGIKVYDVDFAEQKLICTQWFHTDCLASYYKVDVFSDEYWRIVENFMQIAVDYGINFILTPIFTPPLDTKVGGERPTVQLVDVEVCDDGSYKFGFDNFKKWVALAQKCGIKYFEMAHLFTQWGANHAPKIMAKTKDGEKRIFGWDTNAYSKGYKEFLKQFSVAFAKVIDELGIRDKCYFHTSDEPMLKDYFKYKKSSAIMKECFKDFKKIDAISEYIFYKKGLCDIAIPSIQHIDKFAGRVKELWTYYCCLPFKDNYPNRFNAMPSLRNRITGVVLYKYDVKGFLHWGYNFYYSQFSKGLIDPFKTSDAGGAFSSGDAFLVYPGDNGVPYPSIRFKVFYEAIKDFEALKMLEDKLGRDKVIEVLESDVETPIKANVYPHSEQWLISKRNEINRLLSE